MLVRTNDMLRLLQAAENGLRVSRAGGRPAKSNEAANPIGRDIDLTGQPPDAVGGSPTVFVCPDCGGSLWEASEGGLTRFRCHTGHGYTPETLLASQNAKLENDLWSTVRVLMVRAALHRRLAHPQTIREMLAAPQIALERQPNANQSALVAGTIPVPSENATTSSQIRHIVRFLTLCRRPVKLTACPTIG
jgi:hypothetical protein